MISKISHVCKSKFSRVCKHKTTSCFSAVLGSIPSLPPWCFLGSQLPSSCIFIGSVFHCMKVHVSKDQILVKNKCMWYWQICRKWLHIIFRCTFGYLLTGDSENPIRWWRLGKGDAHFSSLSWSPQLPSRKTVSNFTTNSSYKGAHFLGYRYFGVIIILPTLFIIQKPEKMSMCNFLIYKFKI